MVLRTGSSTIQIYQSASVEFERGFRARRISIPQNVQYWPILEKPLLFRTIIVATRLESLGLASPRDYGFG